MSSEAWRITAIIFGVALVVLGARVAGRVADFSTTAYWYCVLNGAFAMFVVACIMLNAFADAKLTPGVQLFAVVTPFFVLGFGILAWRSRVKG